MAKFSLIFIVLIKSVICFEDKTIAEFLTESSGYSFLTQVVTQSNLVDLLNTRNGPPMTVFAPNNAAFTSLGSALNTYLASPLIVEAIAQYHILQEYLPIGLVFGPMTKTTYEGQTVSLDRVNNVVTINGNTHVTSEIVVNNGIILTVDSVLLPPVLPTPPTESIYQIVLGNDNFTALSLAIIIANLTDTLESGEFTLFAPDDAAFVPYLNTLPDPDNPAALPTYQELLKSHIVPGSRRESKLTDGQLLYTLHNNSLRINKTSTDMFVGDARVTSSEMLATNGVVYRIDRLIVAADIIV